jgi:heptosyltransferase-2
MKLLCICPIGIGNYLLCYPSWLLLRAQYPKAKLHLLALRSPIHDLAAPDPLWNAIHLIDPTKQNGLSAVFRLVAVIRSEKFSASLSFFPSNKWQYNLLPLLAGIPRRIGFRYHRKRAASLSWLNTRTIPVDPELHDVKQNLRFTARFLNINHDNLPVTFPELFTGEHLRRASSLLCSDRDTFVAIHAGSSAEHGMDAKRWPPERFGQLADRICSRVNATACIFGGPDEAEIKKAVAGTMSQPHIIFEPQELRLTAALLKKCTLCLCNDSGIMHLAACVGTPVIALFGPTDEKRNGPWGEGHCIVRKEMDGFPLWTAGNVGVRGSLSGINPRKSLLELSVEEAWQHCDGFLQQIKVH